MLRKFVFFISITLLSINAFSQKVLVTVYMLNKVASPSSDTIFHDVNKRLTWNDFQGKPDQQNPGGAVTASGFAFNADITIDRKTIYLNIGVYTYFSKKNSWKKPYIITDYHLLHEQKHFDITRLGAENFIKELVKATFTKDNYNSALNSVFDKVYKDNIALQERYDRETQHSINKPVQLLWNDKIAREIILLK